MTMDYRLLASICWTFLYLIQSGLCHSILDANPNPFDGGPLNSCRKPSFQVGSICQEVVDYEVPSSMARLVQIIEGHIDHNLNDLQDRSEACRNAYRKVLCLQRFPFCERNSTVVLGQQNANYSAELREACDDNVVQRTASQETRLPIDDTCRSISGSNYMFGRCQVDQDNLMAPWMLEYLKMVDQTLNHELDFLFIATHARCGGPLSFHLCNFIGRCTADGQRIEYVNTYESCTSAINCYDHDIQGPLSEDISCEVWPLSAERTIPVTPDSNSNSKISTSKPSDLVNDLVNDLLSTDKNGIFDVVISSALGSIMSLSSLLLGVTLFYVLS